MQAGGSSQSQRDPWRLNGVTSALAAAMSTRKSYYFPQLKAVECGKKSKVTADAKMGIAGFKTEL